MKRSLFVKIASLMLCAIMIFSVCACGDDTPPPLSDSTSGTTSTDSSKPTTNTGVPVNGAKKIVCVDKKLYMAPEMYENISVAYYENQSEILLIEINTAVEKLINESLLDERDDRSVSIEETDTSVILTRENGACCEIDFVEDTVFFSDFDNFNLNAVAENPHDVLCSTYKDENGESVFFQRETSIYTPGYSILIDLAERDIPLDIYKGKKYIPLQTFNDLFVTPHGVNVAYNSKDLFVLPSNALSPELAEIYYLDEPTEKSDALAEFTYNELCLFFDLYYGLQAEHSFTNGFDDYFEKTGLKEKLTSNSALDFYNAIGTLTLGYIADSHSSPSAASPYVGERLPILGMDITIANSILTRTNLSKELSAMRANILGDFNFYEKVGNTAYITFDEFSVEGRSEGYSEEALQVFDTITIILYAHEQISKDEEIENVVVDLSCNGGGAVDSAVYLVAWMLGYCDLSVYNSVTESSATTTYKVDVNLDGVFDNKDNITDKNLYCIVSPASFSCGNYAPALLKASGRVTIVGKTSGGGACIVHHGVAADGTLFCISDASQMSIVVNGSYYHLDRGVEPDITLTKYESIYEREALTEYLNGLK